MAACTEERFLTDIADHKMTILLDNKVYRHLHFAMPNTGAMHFELITGPGFLLYRGDMGCYEFERLHDMFEFFRTNRDYNKSRGRNLTINPYYWGEKLKAESRFGNGYKAYSEALFAESVEERVKQFLESDDDVDEAELREAVYDDVLSRGGTEHEAWCAIFNFKFEDHEVFTDFDYDLTEYTFHYLWACYAISWGIEQYDITKATGEQS